MSGFDFLAVIGVVGLLMLGVLSLRSAYTVGYVAGWNGRMERDSETRRAGRPTDPTKLSW